MVGDREFASEPSTFASFALSLAAADSIAEIDAIGGHWLPLLDQRDRAAGRQLVSMHAELLRRIDEAGQLALEDPLTGAANRRALSTRADERIGRWHAASEPFALGVLDVDRFKEVNDRHGHSVGDEVLKLLVTTLQSQCRSDDVIARVGGEEFIILIAGATEEIAERVFERIRAAVASLELRSGETSVMITASIGFTTVGPDDADIDALVARADTALYDAKAAGRDRVAHRRP